ncbi:Yqey-like protein-domain-containing protein [Cantharellus anzutake]|uniref:Yqey-like protein-domain-containing protein n=1 Tax=Cantharellus anzutake TaxID=1750568 RepID=UPI001906EF9B|nr:Yqey-like protein-domain-containing protein [Cantharellus anzutake]KAF8332049.1 Yqey-like protein-domain-containing protein [Cantharellus anzutake]
MSTLAPKASMLLRWRPIREAAMNSRGFHACARLFFEQVDIRAKLKTNLITAMKARDSLTSTTLKSIIAEITNADKVGPSPIKSAAIYSIINKSIARREDASAQYTAASRSDLAAKELTEASILKSLLPPPLSDEEITRHLTHAIQQVRSSLISSSSSGSVHPGPGALQGKVIKMFWNLVEPGTVPGDVVAKKAKELLLSQPST